MEFGEITNTQKEPNSQRRSGVEGPWDKVGTLEFVKIGHRGWRCSLRIGPREAQIHGDDISSGVWDGVW